MKLEALGITIGNWFDFIEYRKWRSESNTSNTPWFDWHNEEYVDDFTEWE